MVGQLAGICCLPTAVLSLFVGCFGIGFVVLRLFALGAFGSASGVDVGLGGWLWWWSVRVRWVWDWHRRRKRVSRCGWVWLVSVVGLPVVGFLLGFALALGLLALALVILGLLANGLR